LLVMMDVFESVRGWGFFWGVSGGFWKMDALPCSYAYLF
jgi:hypothetical protein